MIISVRLHGSLRDRLPREQRGQTSLDLPEGSTIRTVLQHFEIDRAVAVSLNEGHEADEGHVLRNGDRLQIFAVMGGGAGRLTMGDRA